MGGLSLWLMAVGAVEAKAQIIVAKRRFLVPFAAQICVYRALTANAAGINVTAKGNAACGCVHNNTQDRSLFCDKVRLNWH